MKRKKKGKKLYSCGENPEFIPNIPIHHRAVLAIVIILYISSLVLITLYLGDCTFFVFLQFPLLFLSTSGNHKSDIFFYEVFFFSFSLNSTNKWDHAVFVFLCLTYFT